MRHAAALGSSKASSGKARWKAEALLEELRQVATKLGLEVREEKLLREVGYSVRSGRCRVREQNLVLLDKDLPAPTRLELLLEVVAELDLGDIYLSPELRRMLGREET